MEPQSRFHVRMAPKINYRDGEGYGHKELIEIGKAMVANVAGLKCAWVHPRISTR